MSRNNDPSFRDRLGHASEAKSTMLAKVKQATTVEGVAVKARAAAHLNDELWKKPFKDLDWNEMFVRDFIDTVLEIVGQPFSPLPSHDPIVD